MKKTLFALLLTSLLALACLYVPKATANEEIGDYDSDAIDAIGTKGELISENSTLKESAFTSEVSATSTPEHERDGVYAVWEQDIVEGSHPIYVLVFADEEERATLHWAPFGFFGSYIDWKLYALLQIEKGDEELAPNFGIDIRILDFLEWDSDNNTKSMYDLFFEFYEEKKNYLNTWYDGSALRLGTGHWDCYVDAIIGITAQETFPGDSAGRAHASLNTIIMKWQVYWADDNLVQHEVSHLYGAPDHLDEDSPGPCCIMAYHWHYVEHISEDECGWLIYGNIRCSYLSYFWCDESALNISSYSRRYVWNDGDVNGDGTVEIEDLSTVAKAFGSWRGPPAHPRWNPDADLDQDGTVDISDMAIVAANFGKVYFGY